MHLHRSIARRLGYDLRRLEKVDSFDANLMRFFSHHTVDLVIDCGAFVGDFAVGCRNAGYTGPILSLEPATAQFSTLRERAEKDPQWEARNIGVGIRREIASLRVFPAGGNLNSLFNPKTVLPVALWEDQDMSQTEDIEIQRLDEILEQRISTDTSLFLKTDTQGNDLNVIRSLGARLRQVVAILVEMSVQPIYDGTPSHWETLEFLRNEGFELYSFSPITRDSMGALVEYDAMFRRPLVRAIP